MYRTLIVALDALAATACSTTPPRPMPATAIDRGPPDLLSAFFGLDNALPGRTRLICRDAPGSDGMPVILSHRIAASAYSGRSGGMDASVFEVELASGERVAPDCAAPAPALDVRSRSRVGRTHGACPRPSRPWKRGQSSFSPSGTRRPISKPTARAPRNRWWWWPGPGA